MVINLKDGTQVHFMKPASLEEAIKVIRERLGDELAEYIENIVDGMEDVKAAYNDLISDISEIYHEYDKVD